ncbi:CMRF35-like molecule 5 [Synchiropus splendidus]|uniref:CMRF35-like molecule 5 n=1 Tax=Synchiropus splendidus TaxID=270530 RepID=UPI00237D907E|nr:CMRF35-like molecule 5 [Synchiropus splendidus]
MYSEMPLMILACFLAVGSDVANGLRLTGKEGEDITITCSHSNAYGNTKYFCRGECDYKDILITSEGPNTAKYHITDRGNDFDVTIYNLEVKDSGLYWCGIDRVGVDTYTRVDLTVEKAPEVTDTSGQSKDSTRPSDTVVYIGAGLGICFTILVLVLLLLFLLRRRRSADPDEKPDGRSANSPDPGVIYSDVTLNRTRSPGPMPTIVPPSEAVTYSTIRGAHADSV